MPLLEEHSNGDDSEVQEEEDLEVSSHDSSMPPLEGVNDKRSADHDKEAPSNAQVMNGEPVGLEEVEVKDVLSEEESDGESSNNSLLEDNVGWPQPSSFPAVDATTRPNTNNICPMADSLARNVLALADEARMTGVPISDSSTSQPTIESPSADAAACQLARNALAGVTNKTSVSSVVCF